jgi:hypothetical protein
VTPVAEAFTVRGTRQAHRAVEQRLEHSLVAVVVVTVVATTRIVGVSTSALLHLRGLQLLGSHIEHVLGRRAYAPSQ